MPQAGLEPATVSLTLSQTELLRQEPVLPLKRSIILFKTVVQLCGKCKTRALDNDKYVGIVPYG